MRFNALHIAAYGGFTDRRIDLPRGNRADLHIVEGPNESGKSTLMRAVCDYLFGFPHLTDAAYLHDASRLRVGAVIENKAGECRTIFRRKGRQLTLRDADDHALPDNTLLPFVGSIDRETFQQMFGLNGERLRKAADDILEAKGSAAVGFFEAGSGGVGVKGVLDDIKSSAAKLFKSGGQNPRLNVIRSSLKELQQKIAEQSVPGSDWTEAQRNLEAAAVDQAEAAKKLQEVQRRQRKLERIRRNIGRIARRCELVAKIAEHEDVPRLAADATERRLAAKRALEFAERDRDAVAVEIDGLETRRKAIQMREDVIVLSDRVEGLKDRIGETISYINDAGTKIIQARQQREIIVALMLEADLPGDPENVKELLPKSPMVARMQQLIRTQQGLKTALGKAVEDKTRLANEVADVEKENAGLLAPIDTTALETAIEAVASLGSPERGLAVCALERRQMEMDAADMIARLPGWRGTSQEIKRLTVPTTDTATKFVQVFQTMENAIVQAAARSDESEQELAASQDALRRAEAGGEVPTETMLTSARSERDEKWDVIRRLHIDPKPDGEGGAQIAEIAGEHGPGLPDEFEKAIETADVLSDRLRREADRVANYAIASDAVAAMRTKLEDRQGKIKNAGEENQKAEKDWKALWPSGVDVRSPSEMLEWLRLRQEILQTFAKADQLKIKEEGQERDVVAAHSRLDQAMESLGETAVDPKETLSAKLVRARELLRRKQADQQHLLLKQQALNSLRQQLKTAERKAAEDEAALKEWSVQWGAALKEIRAKPEAATAEVDALLALHEQVSTALDEWQATGHRVNAMNDLIAAFDKEVCGLAERIDRSLIDASTVETARKLVGLAARNARAVEDLANLDKDLEAKRSKHCEHAAAAKDSTDELVALCIAADCAYPSELPAIEAAAVERATAEQDLQNLDLELRQDSDGMDLATLEAEVEGVDRDALPSQIDALDASIRELQQQSTLAGERKAQAQSALEAMSRRAGAFAPAQEYQQQRAALIPLVHDYVRLVLAADVLEAAIEQYRQIHQEPLVTRAGEIFSQITRGRYSGIDVYDGVLRGIESGKGIPYGALSDGTRDQLYLCLRVAAVEHAIDGVEPLPFIGDDLWVGADPSRCEGILRALHFLAQRTQVIIFTHHPFLTELALGIDPATNVVKL
jgi:uncharacterized protein YhaN